MASVDLKEGDEVSWNWGSAHPSGTVAEIVTEGQLEIESKGKQVHKNASPSNPAVHVERKGNDVVKRASELTKEGSADGEHESVSGESVQAVDTALVGGGEQGAADEMDGKQENESGQKDETVGSNDASGEKRKRSEEEGEEKATKDTEGGKKKKAKKSAGKDAKPTSTKVDDTKKRRSAAKSKSSGGEKKKSSANTKSAATTSVEAEGEDGGPADGTRSKDH